MIFITVLEYSEITKCPRRTIKDRCKKGILRCKIELNSKNRPQYMIPLTELTPKQQIEYYKSKGLDLPDELLPKRQQKGNREEKPKAKFKKYEQLSEAEREQVNEWKRIINDWESFRATADCGKTKANKMLSRCTYFGRYTVQEEKSNGQR